MSANLKMNILSPQIYGFVNLFAERPPLSTTLISVHGVAGSYTYRLSYVQWELPYGFSNQTLATFHSLGFFLDFCVFDWWVLSSAVLMIYIRGLQRCRLSLLTNSALEIKDQMRGEGGVAGSQPMSSAGHITWHGAQINFEDLPPYLTYDLHEF